MTCIHLRKLYQLCEEHDVKLSGSDLIRVVCNQCGEQEVCPATLTDQYDARIPQQVEETESANNQCADDSPT